MKFYINSKAIFSLAHPQIAAGGHDHKENCLLMQAGQKKLADLCSHTK